MYPMPTADHQALIDRVQYLVSQWETLIDETAPRIAHDRAEGFEKSATTQETCVMVLDSCVSELKDALGELDSAVEDLSDEEHGGESDRRGGMEEAE